MFPVGTAIMCALFAASVRLNASPIACPDKVRELMHSEFRMVAVPLRWKLASCVSAIKIVGSIGSGLGVELKVPL